MDLQNIPFRKGDIIDIWARRHFKVEDVVKKEQIKSFDGFFEVIDLVHMLNFDLDLTQNTTYKKCIVYLKRL